MRSRRVWHHVAHARRTYDLLAASVLDSSDSATSGCWRAYFSLSNGRNRDSLRRLEARERGFEVCACNCAHAAEVRWRELASLVAGEPLLRSRCYFEGRWPVVLPIRAVSFVRIRCGVSECARFLEISGAVDCARTVAPRESKLGTELCLAVG